MPPAIFMRDGCIWVESDLDYFQIVDSFDKVLSMKECPVKGLIWHFSSKPISIKFDEMSKLTSMSRKLFKGIDQSVKIAIITASAFHSSIFACFNQIAQDLPFRLEVFAEPELAFEWISSG